MVDPKKRESFADELVAQDPGISDTSLKEQRMKLQQAIIELDEKVTSSRRLIVGAIAAFFLLYLVGQVYNELKASTPGQNTVFVEVLMVCVWIVLITLAVAITRYRTIHRPKLEKGRFDLQKVMFEELQSQVSQLSDRVSELSKRDSD